MASAASAVELFDRGLFCDAARTIDGMPNANSELLALRALLESHIGSATRASSAAHSLLRTQLHHRERSVCWEVIGRTALSIGDVNDGLRAMSKAFDASDAAHDARLDARLRASYTESLLHCVGLEPAALEMPRLRQSARRAGDPYSLVEFHSINAEVNAQRGLLAGAATSIDTARALLEKFPNVAQEGRLEVIASALAVAHCDYQSALKCAERAFELALRSGVEMVRLPALNNLVYLKFTQRHFDEAKHYLMEIRRALSDSNPIVIGYRDTELMLALACDDLEAASLLVSNVTRLAATQANRSPYYEHLCVPNQVRWMYRTGSVDSGIERARDALRQLDDRKDHALITRLKLLDADGTSKKQMQDAATSKLVEALHSNSDPSLELIAESLRVAGLITAQQNSTASRHYFSQASRILEGLGNLASKSDVDRDAAEAFLPNTDATQSQATDNGTGFSRCADRLSVFLELGAHIPTLARETALLVVDAGVVYRSTSFAFQPDGTTNTTAAYVADEGPSGRINGLTHRIEIGVHRSTRFVVDCIPRPESHHRIALFNIERLVRTASILAESRQRARERMAAFPEPSPERQLGLIYSSERMIELVNTIRRVAVADVTVLLSGDTGVGKELFARALHQASHRSDKTFLPFNCGTVPKDLIDSQLFGHRRGAFTGAHVDSPGVIRSAAGGTLFLDEVGEMAIETQPKLLRFLESGEILPLGEMKPHTVDVRIVAATNANLDQMVADGRFREDLYYRLNVIRINIPPLRERREEIPALVEHFLERFGRELQKPMLRVADETLEYLVLYRWPGNVRQLSNEVRRMVALAEPNSVLMPAHLSDDIVASRRTIPAGNVPRGFSEVVARIDQPLSAAIEHIERAAIQRALSMTDGNLVEAAKMLGLSRKGLYLKRQRLKLG